MEKTPSQPGAPKIPVMVLRYHLRVDPAWQAHACYALDVLLEGMGVPALPTDDVAVADLIYAPTCPPEAHVEALWIQADPHADWNRMATEQGWVDAMPVVYQTLVPQPGFRNRRHIRADLLYSAFALLTGQATPRVERNAWGVPLARRQASDEARGLMAWPVVALYVHYLSERLQRILQDRWAPVPRWPDGKRYAVVLSHDVDRPFAYPTHAFYRARLHRDLQQRHWYRALRGLPGYGLNALRQWRGQVPVPEQAPNFGFRYWQDLEARVGSRSCFYVAVTRASDPTGTVHDIYYDAAHPAFVAAMHEALAAGWEIGLHASINAWKAPARFVEEKAKLERLLGGVPVRGVRHHHWSLEPHHPARTWRAHAAAGFVYDSSLGLNDAPGYRRAMCWPFNPFDREARAPVPLLQVPPTLMDGGIFSHDVTLEQGAQQLRRHLDQTFAYGGAAVLDWHLEQSNPKRLHGAGPALAQVLEGLADDPHIYWATPADLADWWHERRQRIAAHLPVRARPNPRTPSPAAAPKPATGGTNRPDAAVSRAC